MIEIFSSFDVLEVGGTEHGYKVFVEPNGYLIKEYALGDSTKMYRLNEPVNWEDPLAVGEAEIKVSDGVIDGSVHYKGRWYSKDTINKIQNDRQDYNWMAYV